MSGITSQFTVKSLPVEVHTDAASLGRSAARRLAEALTRAVDEHGSARFVAATGNSQFPLMAALADESVPWSKVTVFHMDEYIGIGADHTASFRRWIRERIQDRFSPQRVDYIQGDAADPVAEIARYEAALREAPLDVVCMGIGENGHLAFNEPFVSDFADPAWVREISLEAASLRQQVNEGHFPSVDTVPASAISLTIPALLSAETVIVSAPERRKAHAVAAALFGPISNACPASILQEATNAVLLLDAESASEIDLAVVR